MNPVNWFEIPITDVNRSKKFYEAVFGLQITLTEFGPLKMGWFPMENGVYGATGSLVKGDGYIPSHSGTLVYFSVPDIEVVLERVKTNGGKVLQPKTGIGQYGFIAHFEDSEGNKVALHSDN
jgi:predicted enzyme related to lactoylglutathione lyase